MISIQEESLGALGEGSGELDLQRSINNYFRIVNIGSQRARDILRSSPARIDLPFRVREDGRVTVVEPKALKAIVVDFAEKTRNIVSVPSSVAAVRKDAARLSTVVESMITKAKQASQQKKSIISLMPAPASASPIVYATPTATATASPYTSRSTVEDGAYTLTTGGSTVSLTPGSPTTLTPGTPITVSPVVEPVPVSPTPAPIDPILVEPSTPSDSPIAPTPTTPVRVNPIVVSPISRPALPARPAAPANPGGKKVNPIIKDPIPRPVLPASGGSKSSLTTSDKKSGDKLTTDKSELKKKLKNLFAKSSGSLSGDDVFDCFDARAQAIRDRDESSVILLSGSDGVGDIATGPLKAGLIIFGSVAIIAGAFMGHAYLTCKPGTVYAQSNRCRLRRR